MWPCLRVARPLYPPPPLSLLSYRTLSGLIFIGANLSPSQRNGGWMDLLFVCFYLERVENCPNPLPPTPPHPRSLLDLTNDVMERVSGAELFF